MTTIYAIHEPFADHLAEVIEEMRVLGAPTLHVVDCGDHYQALEGSHRLPAAAALGLNPVLVVHEQDEMLEITGFDWFEPLNWAGTVHSAGEVAGELFSAWDAVPYSFLA